MRLRGTKGKADIQTKGPRFYLSRVRINSCGYDRSGAYYGLGQPLYRAEPEYDQETGLDAYYEFRAYDREDAKAYILTKHPTARFFN